MASTKSTHIVKVAGIDVEVEDETGRATLAGVRAFFGDPALTAKEIMACKRGAEGLRSHWDDLAVGIGNGTLTYS